MEVHRRRVLHQLRRHLGDVLFALGLDGAGPVSRRGRPLGIDAIEQRGNARTNVADHRRDDLDVGIHFLRLDVDLDELLRSVAPGLALAVREQPVEACADQENDVGILENGGACRARALRMGVWQKALGHAHRQERNAGLLDQGADGVVGLGIGRALAEQAQRTFGALEHIERALDGGGSRKLGRSRVDHFHQRLGAGIGIHHLREQFRRQIEIDAAGTAGHSRADRAGHGDADVLRVKTRNAALQSGLAMAS